MQEFVLVIVLLGLFFSTTPIGISFIATAILLFLWFTSTPLIMVAQGLFSKLNSFPLEAVLFFILLGNIMKKGNSSLYLINFTKSLLFWLQGGLGIAGVMACTIFGAISGSATATVVAIMPIMIPAMVSAKYDRFFAIGLMTTSSILGVIIPPSILMILYAVVANVSIAKLFLGGLLPGVLIAVALSIYTAIVCKRKGYGAITASESVQDRPVSEILIASKKASFALFLPFIVLGGIYAGIFTPTEAAVVGCVYGFFIEVCIYRTIGFKSCYEIFRFSGITTGALLITLAGAKIFCDYLTMQQIPQDLANFVVESIKSPIVFLICFNLLFLFLGTFIDPLSAIMVVTPVLLPTIHALGMDPLFLGVILAINLGLGYCTPPLGANLFVASLVMDESYSMITKAVIPPIIIYFIMLILINAFPSIVMFLPNAIM